MKIQIKKWGDSRVLVLPPVFLKYMDLKEDDWIDISDICRCNPKRSLK